MQLFTEIFIEPERQRIDQLKKKEKQFSNLVLNVVNDQYDEILGIRTNKTVAANEKKSEFMPVKARQRPLSSISKTTSAVNNFAQRSKNLRLVSATTKRENRKRLQSAKPTRRINSAFPGSRLAHNINTNARLGK